MSFCSNFVASSIGDKITTSHFVVIMSPVQKLPTTNTTYYSSISLVPSALQSLAENMPRKWFFKKKFQKFLQNFLLNPEKGYILLVKTSKTK